MNRPCTAVADSVGPGINESRRDEKMIATFTARAAIAGYELVQLADGSFVVGRWGLVRSLDDVAAVEKFLVRAGAPS